MLIHDNANVNCCPRTTNFVKRSFETQDFASSVTSLIFGRSDLHYNILSKSLVLPILEAGSQPHLLCEEHLSLPVFARSCIDCTEEDG